MQRKGAYDFLFLLLTFILFVVSRCLHWFLIVNQTLISAKTLMLRDSKPSFVLFILHLSLASEGMSNIIII